MTCGARRDSTEARRFPLRVREPRHGTHSVRESM
jgi:hypothetical protein